MRAMDELLIVTTGGTIDKVYFDDKSDYQVGEPQIGHILEELGVAFRFRVIPMLRKDSLHIDAADRELLRATIAAQDARHVLVTHGTDTMVETANVLASIPGQDHRADRRTESGAVSRLGRGVQHRHRGRRRAVAAGWRVHRDERPRLGSGEGAQERRRQPLRGDLSASTARERAGVSVVATKKQNPGYAGVCATRQ